MLRWKPPLSGPCSALWAWRSSAFDFPGSNFRISLWKLPSARTWWVETETVTDSYRQFQLPVVVNKLCMLCQFVWGMLRHVAGWGTWFGQIVSLRTLHRTFLEELVYGEDDQQRAEPDVVKDLFQAVRDSYFRLYFNFMYFDVAKQLDVRPWETAALMGFAPCLCGESSPPMKFCNVFERRVRQWFEIPSLLNLSVRTIKFEDV